MVKTIEPPHHHFHQSKIESFLNLMKVYQNVLLSDEEKKNAVFIIAQNAQEGVYGGAVLYKKNLYTLHEKIRKVLLTFLPQQEEVWTATTGYYGAKTEITPLKGIADLNLKFYSILFEKFKEIGSKKNINFLCLTLTSQEYIKTKNKGFWPYIMEVSPESSHDLFQGMVTLQ